MTKFAGTMILFLMAWTSAPGVEPPPVEKQDKQADYYPLRVGNKWQFELEVKGKTIDAEYQVAKIEQIDGQALACIEASMDGKAAATEHLATSDKGIFRHRTDGMELTPPVCLLKYPIKEGETWTGKTKASGAGELIYKCRVGKWENVEVPAGKFKTITMNISLEQGGMTIVSDYWFAAGVGIVKQEFDMNGLKFSLKLKKFEEGK